MITIRTAVETDINHLVEFNMAMALETEKKQLVHDVIYQGVKGVLTHQQPAFYLLAEIHREIAGCLMITTEWSDWRNGVFWWIQSVYVKPDYRLKGVFKALHKETKRMAQNDANVIGLRLYVEENNKTAQQTYHSLGMKKTHYQLYEEAFNDN